MDCLADRALPKQLLLNEPAEPHYSAGAEYRPLREMPAPVASLLDANARISALEAELARAYVNLADAASLCGMAESQRRLLSEDGGSFDGSAGGGRPSSLLEALLPQAANSTHCNCNGTEPEGAFMPPFTEQWWMVAGSALGCICVAALA